MPTLPLLVLLPFAALGSCRVHQEAALDIRVGELTRNYIEHVPEELDVTEAAPLVLVFHGGSGSAEQAQRTFGFDAIADEHKFLVAYPDGIDGHWNDGRGSEKFAEQDAKTDDVAYAMAVVRDMQRRHSVDAARIYAVGISNGGMFVQRLALEHSETFAAIASPLASLPAPLAESFEPEQAISVLFMHGTDDRIVPFGGGEVVFELFPRWRWKKAKPSRGRVVPVEEAAALWAKHAGLLAKPARVQLPDLDPDDGARAERLTWSAPENPHTVELYRITGGGHTLPGSEQRLSKRLVGATCGDFRAPEAVWRFLADKRRE